MTMKLTRRAFGALAAGGLAAQLAPKLAFAETPLAGRSFNIGIHNRTPWGYRRDNQVVGYHPDIVRAVLAPLGATFEFTVADFGALIPGLLANRFDIIASGVAITPQRCQQVLFSEPDLAVGDGLLVRAGNPKNLHSYADIARNANVALGGGRGTTNAANALAAGVPADRLMLFPNNEAVVSAILAGRVDAGTLSAPSAAGVVNDTQVQGIERALPFQGLMLPNGQPAMMYTGVVFRRSDTALRDLYNQGLAALKRTPTFREIMARNGFTDDELPGEMTTANVCSAA